MSPCYPGVECTPTPADPDVVSSSGADGFSCGPCPRGLIGDGRRCRLPRIDDPCESSPCHPGVRCFPSSDGGGFQCGLCPEGTEGDGTVCLDINDCSGSPCHPGVMCEDRQAPERGFDCGKCPQGYQGDGRECRKLVRFKVNCPDGKRCFPGVKCYLTSLSGANSNGTAGEVVCGDCPQGFYGDGHQCKPKCHNLKCKPDTEYCSAPDTCTPSCLPGCKNGGRCVRPGHCKCRRGFKGDRCQHSSSTSLTPSKHKSCVNGGSCKNGGTCNQLTATCQCPFGTYGKFCQKREEPTVGFLLPRGMTEQGQIPRCKRRCINGGVCLARKNRCKCPPGFRGRFCQKPKCKGGCRNGSCVAPNRCQCEPGFAGPNCRKAVCSPMCLNGGKCLRGNKCRCKKDFTGQYCELKNRRRRGRRRNRPASSSNSKKNKKKVKDL